VFGILNLIQKKQKNIKAAFKRAGRTHTNKKTKLMKINRNIMECSSYYPIFIRPQIHDEMTNETKENVHKP